MADRTFFSSIPLCNILSDFTPFSDGVAHHPTHLVAYATRLPSFYIPLLHMLGYRHLWKWCFELLYSVVIEIIALWNVYTHFVP